MNENEHKKTNFTLKLNYFYNFFPGVLNLLGL